MRASIVIAAVIIANSLLPIYHNSYIHIVWIVSIFVVWDMIDSIAKWRK